MDKEYKEKLFQEREELLKDRSNREEKHESEGNKINEEGAEHLWRILAFQGSHTGNKVDSVKYLERNIAENTPFSSSHKIVIQYSESLGKYLIGEKERVILLTHLDLYKEIEYLLQFLNEYENIRPWNRSGCTTIHICLRIIIIDLFIGLLIPLLYVVVFVLLNPVIILCLLYVMWKLYIILHNIEYAIVSFHKKREFLGLIKACNAEIHEFLSKDVQNIHLEGDDEGKWVILYFQYHIEGSRRKGERSASFTLIEDDQLEPLIDDEWLADEENIGDLLESQAPNLHSINGEHIV